jgi:hypothetical protein
LTVSGKRKRRANFADGGDLAEHVVMILVSHDPMPRGGAQEIDRIAHAHGYHLVQILSPAYTSYFAANNGERQNRLGLERELGQLSAGAASEPEGVR